MLTDLAGDLSALGWRVTVLTSRTEYRHAGRRLAAREVRNGVLIVRTSRISLGEHSLAKRAVDFAAYFMGTAWHLLTERRHSIVAAMSDPPFVAALALAAARARGARSVFWVQDVFPQIAAKLGVLRERGWLYRAFRRIAAEVNARCDLVIVLGERMAETTRRAGARPTAVQIIHNWVDTSAVVPVSPTENPFLKRHGLEGRFVIMYSGNAGRAHEFATVIDAARKMTDDPGVVFLFIGSGPRMPEIRRAAEAGVQNLRVLDAVPREELRFSLSAASVSLVTEQPAVVGHVVPSKVYGILASGRPLVFVGAHDSDVASIIRQHHCGLIISPQDSDGLVRALCELRSHPSEVAQMGARARDAAERFYDRRVATQKWEAAANSLLQPFR
jgi:colanic acid biosynthesis glycosyl transferase WcaI